MGSSIPAFMSVDSTYCSIRRRSEAGRDVDLGEMTYNEGDIIAEGVTCTIDAVVNKPTGTIKSAVDMFEQGQIEASHYKITMSATVDIKSGDVVIDPDGLEYEIDSIAPFSSHKEARAILIE